VLPDERTQPVQRRSSAAAAARTLPALRQLYRTALWPGCRGGKLVGCRPARQADVAGTAGGRALQTAAQVIFTLMRSVLAQPTQAGAGPVSLTPAQQVMLTTPPKQLSK